MEYRFKSDEWARLSAAERIKRCRLIAFEASEAAAQADTREMKRIYLRLAEDWEKLAREIERMI